MSDSGTITILFTDLVESTPLSARLGDAAMDQVRRAHFVGLRAALDATSGIEVKTVGDALMASYRSTADAVSGAVAMQQSVARANRRPGAEPLAMRVGISCGDATYEDADWYGTPVVEAARLCAVAEAGQILVADVVRVLAGNRGGHSFTPVGALELKGLPDPVPSCEVLWEDVARPTVVLPVGLSSAVRTPLVGREAEALVLRERWSRSRSGERTFVVVGGDPGVGKTRLVAELAREQFEAGATVLFGRCDEDTAAPFRPFVEALRPLAEADPAAVNAAGPDLGRLLPGVAEAAAVTPADPDTERLWMFDAVERLLVATARSAPVLFVLDDLHWADRPSLQLLRHLVRSSEPAPLLVLGTYRETDLTRAHPLTELLADLRRDKAATRLALTGLDLDGTAAMIETRSGAVPDVALAAAVHAETEGNPFFVEEVVAHLWESNSIGERNGRLVALGKIDEIGIPEGVREVVGRRLSRLGNETNSLLLVASVIGREWELEVARRAAGLERDLALDAVEEALHARLIEEVSGAGLCFAFTHALVRSTLADELSITQRVRLHGRVGRAIEELYSGRLDERLPELARHFADAAAAGEADRAVGYALRAAAQATTLLAFEDAGTLYDLALQALDLLDSPDDERRYQALIGRADSSDRMNRSDNKRREALDAARIARAHGWGDRLAVAAMLYGDDATSRFNPTVLELVGEALELLPPEARAKSGTAQLPGVVRVVDAVRQSRRRHHRRARTRSGRDRARGR